MQPSLIITTCYTAGDDAFGKRDAYAEAVARAGGLPVQARDDDALAGLLRTGQTDDINAMVGRFDGLILSGGGDISPKHYGQRPHPETGEPNHECDAAEMTLCRAFVRAGKPVLGICRGMQVLNVAMGGDLIQDIPSRYGLEPALHGDRTLRHTVEVAAYSWLERLFGARLVTNSSHHQAVGRVALGFAVAARLGAVIEAMERGNVLGVQFHPERMLDEGMLPLFEDFIGRCSYAAVV